VALEKIRRKRVAQAKTPHRKDSVNTRYVRVDAVAEKAAEVRARYNLKLTDSLQIAAAIAAGCDDFLTNDSALKRVSGITILALGDLEV
jgi:predicted nucleic acid-binding protein